MTERYNQVMQFLRDHITDVENKSTELHEIAIMMRNCLDELADTKKKLDIAIGALKWIDETYELGQELETDIKAKCQYTLEQINQKETI